MLADRPRYKVWAYDSIEAARQHRDDQITRGYQTAEEIARHIRDVPTHADREKADRETEEKLVNAIGELYDAHGSLNEAADWLIGAPLTDDADDARQRAMPLIRQAMALAAQAESLLDDVRPHNRKA